MNEPESLLDVIRRHAELTPNAEALGAPCRKALSYAGLWEQITAVAGVLDRIGLSGDQTIAVSLPDGPELAVLCLAAAATARCAVLNPSSRFEEFAFYLSDLNAQALVVLSGTDSAAIPVAKQNGIRVLEIVPLLGSAAGIFDLAGPQKISTNLCYFRKYHDIALQIYTSGTTAKPKVVPLSHLVISESARNIRETLQLSPTDRCLNVMPMFHAHALVLAIASSLFSGGSIICSSGFEPERFFEWIEGTRPTWYSASPAIHKAVLSEASRRGIQKHPLRLIRSSASALRPALMKQMEDLFGVSVLEGYGMTECPLIAANSVAPALRKPGSVGRPAGPALRIVDENGKTLPQGGIGEIIIRGGGVAGHQNTWLHTGDMGFQDIDGFLFLTSRLKEIINRGGQKISPLEVESALQQHPSVQEAITFGFQHETLGEEIAAAVILRKNFSATEKEIRSFMFEKLVDYKVPRRIIFVEQFPRTETGKVLRHELARQLLNTQNMRNLAKLEIEAASSNSIEQALQRLWSDVLGIPSIGIHDDFFYLGGDSIQATRLVSRIRNEFRVELPLRSFFEVPTIAEISRQIQTGSGITLELSSTSFKPGRTSDDLRERPFSAQATEKTKGEMQFSLFFFSADGSASSQDKYRLLIESAKFADQNNFKAIWVPERHFHPFGGLYPNPSVLGAALATITTKIQIRAGSVVLPLQDPVRVAEEWSVVDNLSNGRVAISCASGWHINDFVLSPKDYSDRKRIMFERIEIIQRLWKGEKITLPNGAGNLVDVGIFPKPLQPHLPMWLSCHSDETFRQAGRMGLNVITTLYKSRIDRVVEQISFYRKTLDESGYDADSKTVAIMLHTYLAENEDLVAEKTRSAYGDYLLSFLGLQKDQAEGQNQEFQLTESDQRFLLSRGIDRLYNIRDLVGTPDVCAQKVAALRAAGVDEIACLIDFGIDSDSVLASLHQLNQLRLMTADMTAGKGIQ